MRHFVGVFPPLCLGDGCGGMTEGPPSHSVFSSFLLVSIAACLPFRIASPLWHLPCLDALFNISIRDLFPLPLFLVPFFLHNPSCQPQTFGPKPPYLFFSCLQTSCSCRNSTSPLLELLEKPPIPKLSPRPQREHRHSFSQRPPLSLFFLGFSPIILSFFCREIPPTYFPSI